MTPSALLQSCHLFSSAIKQCAFPPVFCQFFLFTPASAHVCIGDMSATIFVSVFCNPDRMGGISRGLCIIKICAGMDGSLRHKLLLFWKNDSFSSSFFFEIMAKLRFSISCGLTYFLCFPSDAPISCSVDMGDCETLLYSIRLEN